MKIQVFRKNEVKNLNISLKTLYFQKKQKNKPKFTQPILPVKLPNRHFLPPIHQPSGAGSTRKAVSPISTVSPACNWTRPVICAPFTFVP